MSVNEFIDVETEEPILETVKKNKAFECSLLCEDGYTKYLHLSPLYISRSYYLMGTEITLEYERRVNLEELSGKNTDTTAYNGFTLANQFKTIMANNDAYDMAFIEYNIHKSKDIEVVFGHKSFIQVQKMIYEKLKEGFPNVETYQISESRFMVVFPNLSIDDVLTPLKSFLDEMRRPLKIKSNCVYITSKVAICNLKRDNMPEDITLEKINEKLDLALSSILDFEGKEYVIYDPAMDDVLHIADEMEKDLETGLLDQEFRMYLQPQFDHNAERIDGFEALIRWMNPKYKDKSPQAFIELAEKRGYMLDIGRFVIRETFKLAKKLEPYNVHVSMNVSPVQLLQPGFVQQIVDEFNAMELKRGSVAIEITETFLMGNFQLMNEKLRILTDLGFHIHLDDFCTGYSSMLYLKDLPVDTIKIDKEFTKNITTNKICENIVKTICALANSLDLDIICEGVERQEQSEMMKRFGCRIIQGYLYGKAMPYEEALVLLEKYNSKKK